MRPASRGVSGAGGMAMRPVTGQRGAMGTAAGQRMQTGRMMTPGQGFASSTAAAAEVQVADRPITNHGIGGMRMKTGGPGRQIQDRSYYLGMLRQKIGEITAEVQKLDGEIQKSDRDSKEFGQLERKYESLIKEVRGLEGTLADFNLAMDKQRARQDPDEIRAYHRVLSERNANQGKSTDDLFMKRRLIEEEIRQMDQEILKVHKEGEDKINALAPEKLTLYRDLLNQNHSVQNQAQTLQQEYNKVSQQVRAMEFRLQEDRYRERYSSLQKLNAKLKKEKAALEDDMRTSRMDPKQAREMMLEKVKADKSRLTQMETRLSQIEDEIESAKSKVSDLSTEVNERNSEDGQQQKYEVLFQRDKEMSAFIDSFEDTTKKEVEAQAKVQAVIVALLEHIAESEDMNRKGGLSNASKGQLNDMREDLSFKEKQMASSQSTKERLESELTKRRMELEKINTLDEKISVELTSLSEKINVMNSEMGTLNNIEQLKGTADQTHATLMRLKQKYNRRRDNVQKQVQLLSAKYEKKKNALSENETAKALEAQEQKLRNYEQNIFHLNEVIKQKEHESDYVTIKDDCNRMLDSLNKKVVQNASGETGSAIHSFN